MNEMPKTRAEIPVKYRWNPDDIYASREEWEKDCTSAEQMSEQLAAFSGTLAQGREKVLNALKLNAELNEHFMRLYSYASLIMNTDNGNAEGQTLNAKALTLYTKAVEASAWLDPELLSLDSETLNAYIADPEFSVFDEYLKNLQRQRPHVRSAEVEQVLAAASEGLSAPGSIFDMLNDVDMKLGLVRDENGKNVPLTNALFESLRESSDRNVRKNAFRRMMGAYESFGSTFAAAYAANVKNDVFMARTRGYASSLEAALDPVQIPVSVYENLVSAVHDAIPVLNAYTALRRDVLNIPTVHMYDLYVPMTEEFDLKLDYEQAYDLLLDAVAPLGSDYRAVVEQARDSRWIDVYETPGKTSGAYSNGEAYGVHPYILMNYRPEIGGLLTLAHEMGHSMHSYYSNNAQPSFKAGYSLFVAEVASTCNEVLTIQSLRKKYAGNREAQIALIGRLLEGFRTTVFRQTMFAEFEQKAHAMEEQGQPLIKDTLSSMYYELNRLYYGGSCRVDKEISSEWMRIPHFYRSFYVYQYATGFCAAVALADRVLNGGEEAVKAYRRFLTLGGSMSPIEELKVAGVDMSTPEPVEAAMDVFAELLAEFSALLAQGN